VVVGVGEGRQKMFTYVPMGAYVSAMEFSTDELGKRDVLMSHVLFGLSKEELLDRFESGEVEYVRRYYPGAPEEGLLYCPSALGIELFLWAYGKLTLTFINSSIRD
jgi:hypothetical protein